MFTVSKYSFGFFFLSQSIDRDMEIKDDEGKMLPAIKVFSECIRYLRQHLTDSLTSRLLNIADDEIQWVLTVPAIWTDSAKQFMRNAGEKVYS